MTKEQEKIFLKRVEKSNLTKSDFIRQSLLNSNIIDMKTINDIYIELKMEGNNLNQLVKKIHQENHPGKNDIKKQLQNLQSTYIELKELLKEIKG